MILLGGHSVRRPLCSVAGGSDTTITDALSRPPPTAGAQDYNSMARPGLGNSYVDSVFGKTVIQLTDIGNNASDDQIYGFHNVNADGTLMFFKRPSGSFDIVSTATGANVYTGQPTGLNASEVRWSHTDPDKYYYPSGTSLLQRNLAAQTNTTLKNFGATLDLMGGSNNSQDGADDLFLANYSGTVHVWERSTDTIYANPVTQIGGTTTITPSGNNVVTFPGPTAEPNKEHYAYLVNKTTKSVGTVPVMFWGLGGGHCSFNSATDGKDYGIFQEAYGSIEIYRCDLSVSVAGMTDTQQRAAQFSLIDIDPADDTHMTSVTVGALKNWCFISTEANHSGGDPNQWDDFNQVPSPWRQYKQEIIALNILTGTSQNANRRRLAHHRSRSVQANYFTTPRLSCSPTGNFIVWASNFNDSVPAGFADRFGIANPLTSL